MAKKSASPETHKVSIVNIGSYQPQDELNAAVLRAIELCGASALLKRGSKVVVKPNLLLAVGPSSAITTHPAVLHAVCEWLSGLDCEIIVGDSSSQIGGAINAFRKSGLAEVAERFGARVVDFDKEAAIRVSTPNASGTVPILGLPRMLVDADCVISLPKLKTHMLTALTCGVKNCFGMVPGGQKRAIHALNPDAARFSTALVDIYEAASPDLTIVDGITCMDGFGPSFGRPRQFGIIAAGTNAAAVDYVMAGITGIGARNVATVQESIRRSLIIPERITVAGDAPRRLVRFRKALPVSRFLSAFGGKSMRVLQRLLVPSPFIDRKKCRKCGACVRICPVKVLDMDKAAGTVPAFARRGDCIHCYCCYEACPFGAVGLSRLRRA